MVVLYTPTSSQLEMKPLFLLSVKRSEENIRGRPTFYYFFSYIHAPYFLGVQLPDINKITLRTDLKVMRIVEALKRVQLYKSDVRYFVRSTMDFFLSDINSI